MVKAIIGWVATLIIVGFTSALFMALGIFTPNLRSLEALTVIKEDTFATSQTVLERAVAEGCTNMAVGQPDFQVRLLCIHQCSHVSQSCHSSLRAVKKTSLAMVFNDMASVV